MSSNSSFKLYNGFHRYHLSVALGFTHIPVAVNLWDENNEWLNPFARGEAQQEVV